MRKPTPNKRIHYANFVYHYYLLGMQEKDTIHIIQSVFLRIEKLINRIEENFDQEAIHDFRVDIKKLRAFLRLINHEPSFTGNLKIPKQLKKIYTACGSIRDLQLQIGRMKVLCVDTDPPNEYLELLEKNLRSETQKCKALFKYLQLQKGINTCTTLLPTVLSKDCFTNFFKEKVTGCLTILTRVAITDTSMHSMRKNIKDIIYIYKIYDEYIKTKVPAPVWNKTEFSKALQEAQTLGLYNDQCIAIGFLQAGWLKKVNLKERKLLQTIRKNWLLENEQIRNNLPQKLTILYKKYGLDAPAENNDKN